MGILSRSQGGDRRSIAAGPAGPLLAALAVVGTACESGVEVMDDFRVVTAVLVAEADTVKGKVDDVVATTGLRTPVESAEVTVTGPGGPVSLSWVPGPACVDEPLLPMVRGHDGCHRAPLPQPVEPGAAYDLVVDPGDGALITGRTRVPPVPVLTILEEPWFRYPLAHPWIPVSMEWDPDPGVGRMEARIAFLRAHRRGGAWTTSHCEAEPCPPEACRALLGEPLVHDPRSGPAELRLSNIGCPFDWDSLAIEIRSTAYDTAYARYIRQVGSASIGVRLANAAAGLDGALGIFGAAASASDTVHIQREPAQ